MQIIGDGIGNSPGIVVSVSEQTGLATVEVTGDSELPRYSDTVQVPLSRLTPPRSQVDLEVFKVLLCVIFA